MTLAEGIRHKGAPFEIPDCTRADLITFLKETGRTTGIEIGVYKGNFTECFCKEGFKICGIDPWSSSDLYRGGQPRQDMLYASVLERTKPYPNCTILRKTSMDALADFPDRSLDFVYIDGHHGFKYIAEDLWEWPRKVKKGGVIAGHDYGQNISQCLRHPHNAIHVQPVVDAYVKCMRIYPWWVLGSEAVHRSREKRERWRTFMWFN